MPDTAFMIMNCTSQFGQLLPYTDDQRTATVPQLLPFTLSNLYSIHCSSLACFLAAKSDYFRKT
jgi:hypothetical protein